MKCGLSHVLSEVDYTYRSKINDECFTLDHFIMTENIFGFKEKHSTTQCTFSMQETIQYYTNSGGPVYLLMLDASKAFDRIQFVKMFKCLMERDICPLIARLIAAIFYKSTSTSEMGQPFFQAFCHQQRC